MAWGHEAKAMIAAVKYPSFITPLEVAKLNELKAACDAWATFNERMLENFMFVTAAVDIEVALTLDFATMDEEMRARVAFCGYTIDSRWHQRVAKKWSKPNATK